MTGVTQQCAVCGGEVSAHFQDDLRDREYATPWTGDVKCCVECGLAQQSPMLTTSEAVALYPPNYQHYDRQNTRLSDFLMRTYLRRTVKKMKDLGVGPGMDMLDIGCGSGQPLSILSQALGCRGVGIEPSPIAAEAARKRFGVEVHVGTFPHPDLAGRKFDIIYLNHVIEHVPDPVGLFRDIGAALKPGGILIGETENVGSLSARLFKQYWALLHLPYHLYFFTESTLKKAFDAAGLPGATINNLTDATAWSLSIQNWFRRKVPAGNHLPPRMPFYVPLTLSCIPLSLVEAGQGPILQFHVKKT